MEAGSVEKAIKGKHYKQALLIHKLVYECLVRLLIERRPLSGESLQKTFEDIKASGEKNVRSLFKKSYIIQSYIIHAAFEEINSADSAMARYWVTYSEMVEILFMNARLGLLLTVHLLDTAMDVCI